MSVADFEICRLRLLDLLDKHIELTDAVLNNIESNGNGKHKETDDSAPD